MTIICNDQLTRVRTPSYGQSWTVPKTYRVGDKGDKNGMPYTVKAFGASIRRRMGVPQFPCSVWLIVKYRGDRTHKWDCLLIGDTNSFQERLIFGGPHPNPIFTHYWPKGAPQPA
jgi:hypothetical protein